VKEAFPMVKDDVARCPVDRGFWGFDVSGVDYASLGGWADFVKPDLRDRARSGVTRFPGISGSRSREEGV